MRNLLVTKIAGENSRLVTASVAEKKELARIAGLFSEEDLTRYLQLSLELFRDLQFSLQPRFHLEIGLLKMIQAGKLLPIEEALANLGGEPRTATVAARTVAAPLSAPPQARVPAPRSPTAPPAAVQSQAAAPPAAPPDANEDWREKLQSAMVLAGLQFSADAMAQSSAALVNNELIITARKEFQLDLGREELLTALKQVGYPALRFKVVFGDVNPAVAAPAARPAASGPDKKKDEVTERALSHPEVQRFRELFGGEVRNVRNLKES